MYIFFKSEHSLASEFIKVSVCSPVFIVPIFVSFRLARHRLFNISIFLCKWCVLLAGALGEEFFTQLAISIVAAGEDGDKQNHEKGKVVLGGLGLLLGFEDRLLLFQDIFIVFQFFAISSVVVIAWLIVEIIILIKRIKVIFIIIVPLSPTIVFILELAFVIIFFVLSLPLIILIIIIIRIERILIYFFIG